MNKNSKREQRMCCSLTIWVSLEDNQRLKEEAARSTCGSFSEFARRLLLSRRTVVRYRNASLDSFIDEAIALRNELRQVRQTLPRTAEQEQRMIVLLENIQLIILKIYEQCKPT